MKKLKYEQVKEIFYDGGCELISNKYLNASTKLKYKCNCGNMSEIFLHSFKKGHRCMECSKQHLSSLYRLKFEYVEKYFKKEGCTLLSTRYINSQSKLEFICTCGRKAINTFSKFKLGRRCKQCGEKKKLSKLKHSYEYVKSKFEEKELRLISKEYVNSSTPLDYICTCGNRSKITFDSLRSGSKCNKCGVERTRGEKSVHWNPNLSMKDRIERRDYPEYREWRTKVYQRDDFVCQKCQQKGGILASHHILNYSFHKDLRLVVSNGVTLCSSCHNNFHIKFGKRKNNQEQLDLFLNKVFLYE